MTKEERVDLLLEAQESIYEAVKKIKEAVAGTGEEKRAEAYVIPSLKMCASDSHGYLGSQPSNISELIEAIEERKAKMKVIIDEDINTNNTVCCGYFLGGTKYSDLVKVFGEPNRLNDDCKIDVEWRGKINGKVFTIYNYKTGKNYLGERGLPVEKITDWHIGGKSKEVAIKVAKYFEEMKHAGS